MIIGDLNSYRMESPIAGLREAGFSDLLAEFEGAGAYTYVFIGAPATWSMPGDRVVP